MLPQFSQTTTAHGIYGPPRTIFAKSSCTDIRLYFSAMLKILCPHRLQAFVAPLPTRAYSISLRRDRSILSIFYSCVVRFFRPRFKIPFLCRSRKCVAFMSESADQFFVGNAFAENVNHRGNEAARVAVLVLPFIEAEDL